MLKLLTNRWMHMIVLSALLLTAVSYSASNQRWRKEMQYLVFDTLNQLHPREKSGQVLIVDIDDNALQEVGQWPWPRTIVADLVEKLTAAGAKVIAFDGVLAEPDRSSPRFILETLPEDDNFQDLKDTITTLPDHDEVLAKAIAQSGIFVSGFTFSSYTQTPRKPRVKKQILARRNDYVDFLEHAVAFKTAAPFLPELEQAAAGNGSFMASADHDGILRRTGLVFSNKDSAELFPSLSLEAIRVAYGDSKLAIKLGPNPDTNPNKIDTQYRAIIGDYTIPVESNGMINVYYRKFDEQGDDYISAASILQGEGNIRQKVQGKLVLIGSSAEGLKDLRSTALEPFQPGVEIHANVIEQILQNEYLLRPNITAVAEASFILIVGLMMIALVPLVHVIVMAIICAGLIAAAFWGAGFAYTEMGLLFDPFYPSLSVFAIFVVSTLLTYLRVESEKHQVRNMFGHYVSPHVMKDLERNPEKLKLGGENKELTVMFTDIRKFTTISEGLSPEELIQLMNEFLTAMTDIVQEHDGTIDKYMGDAMMAFWNAPRDVKDHERACCVAALKMQAALEPINESVKKKAEELGKEPVLLKAGIGINTGLCAVGNMGSRQRFAYSTLGDPVNLASRLEGQTKNYGVPILIGESTYNEVPDFACLEMDLIKVKGKTQAVRIFALLGDETLASDQAFIALKESHNMMISAYQKGEFETAKELAKKGAKSDLYALATLYALYTKRAKDLTKNPPENWDGVFEAKDK